MADMRSWFSNTAANVVAGTVLLIVGFAFKGMQSRVEAGDRAPSTVAESVQVKKPSVGPVALDDPNPVRSSGHVSRSHLLSPHTPATGAERVARSAASAPAIQPPSIAQTAALAQAVVPPSPLAATPVAATAVKAPASAPRSIAKGTELSVQPTADVCDAQLKRGAVIGARLMKDVATSDGGVLAAGTPVRVEVVERRVASGDQEPVISLEATSMQTPTGVVAVESRTLHFVLEKPGIAGTVVKGTIVGAIGGAALGLVLRQNIGKAALIGGAAGGVIGAAKASSGQACIAASSTTFPFTLAQATEIR